MLDKPRKESPAAMSHISVIRRPSLVSWKGHRKKRKEKTPTRKLPSWSAHTEKVLKCVEHRSIFRCLSISQTSYLYMSRLGALYASLCWQRKGNIPSRSTSNASRARRSQRVDSSSSSYAAFPSSLAHIDLCPSCNSVELEECCAWRTGGWTTNAKLCNVLTLNC